MRFFSIKTIIPIVILLILGILLYIFEPSIHLTLGLIKEKEKLVFDWISLHPFLSAFALISTYIFSICLFIPASSALTLIAGIAYPFPYALAISIFSETVGTCLFFILLRSAFRPIHLSNKILNLKKAEKGFKKNPASYLLFLRFSHITPSWLISIVGAMFKAPFWTFLWTTFLGTIPISYLIVDAGVNLKKMHPSSYSFHWESFLSTNTKLLFFGFALLALLPILMKKFIKH
ncbi:MAG: VTT domain-containing protein [Chlamydiota bacterium]